MSKHKDPDLEEAFFNLLLDLSPRLMEQKDTARAFAEQLADFADHWAAGSPDIEERERNLINWIQYKVALAEREPRLTSADLQTKVSRLAWLRRRMGVQFFERARATAEGQSEAHAEAQVAGS